MADTPSNFSGRAIFRHLSIHIPSDQLSLFLTLLYYENLRRMGLVLLSLLIPGALFGFTVPYLSQYATLPVSLATFTVMHYTLLTLILFFSLLFFKVMPQDANEAKPWKRALIIGVIGFLLICTSFISGVALMLPIGLVPMIGTTAILSTLILLRGRDLAIVQATSFIAFLLSASYFHPDEPLFAESIGTVSIFFMAWVMSRFLVNIRLQPYLEQLNLARINRELMREVEERKRVEHELRSTQEILEAHAIAKTTDLQRAVVELADSEEKYRALFEMANDAIFLMDGERFIDCNAKTLEIFRCSRDQIIGQPPYRFSPEYQPDGMESKIKAREKIDAALSGEPQFFEWLHCHHDQSDFDAEVSLSLIELGSKPFLLAIVRDVTDRKRAEQALRESEEKLRQAQKMEAIGRLAGGVAHDFNNLLTAITGNAELALLSLEKPEVLQSQLEEIRDTGDRAAKLTRQLLAFGRRQNLLPKVIDINEILRGMDAMLRRMIGKEITLAFDLEDQLPSIKADPIQFERIITNLAVNARDAMQEGGLLLISTNYIPVCIRQEGMLIEDHGGDCVVLTVRDTGRGMKPEILKNIFEPFYTTKSGGRGTGLGLATVYGIVKQSGGEIHAESRVGEGTVFKISFPAVNTPADARETLQETTGRHEGDETILVVEDDEAVRRLTVNVLVKYGYNVHEAVNGRRALELCRAMRQPVDLILSDVIMPEMNGPVFAVEVRRFWPSVKLVFMSGYLEDVESERGLLELKAPFLPKPFQPLNLVSQIRASLDS